MRGEWYESPRIAQDRGSARERCPAARTRPRRAQDRRGRPGDRRGAAGERPGVVPGDRRAARRLGSDCPGTLRAPLRRADPPGRGRHEPARPRLRAGADRDQDSRRPGAGGRRDLELGGGGLRRRHGRPVRPPRRGRRSRPARIARRHEPHARARRRRLDGDVPVPRPCQAALRLGDTTMTSTVPEKTLDLQKAARDHLWLHFTRMSAYEGSEVPIIVRGDGCYLEDSKGKRYLDALAGLFSVNIGYGFGEEIGEAAAAQMRELPFYTNWGYAHPRAIELASEVASLTPGDLNRLFFVSGGSEAVESAWKLARQYYTARGDGRRWKAISRHVAYHGTTMGALSINGIPALRMPFEPLVPDVLHVRNTNRYHRPAEETEEEFTRFLLDDLEHTIETAGPQTVAMVIMEPVQNAGGAFVAPAGYWRGVREICDRYEILLCADEVICGFGRLGAWFGSELYDIRPDLITCAKGLSSSYASIGAVIASDRVMEPFLEGSSMYSHGITFGGHPVQCAVALKNIEIMKRERIVEHVRGSEDVFRAKLETLLDLDIVGDVRGAGFFYALELVKDSETKQTFDDAECEALLRGYLSPAFFDAGLICRADDRGDPVVQISPPLVAGEAEMDEIVGILGEVLSEAQRRL